MRKYYPKSRAAGTCRQCKAEIRKGQPAWWSQSAGWQCTGCAGNGEPSPAKPAEPSAPRARGIEKPNGLPVVRIERHDGATEIEFDRLADALQAASATGTGVASNASYIDRTIAYYSGKKFFNRRTVESMIRLVRTGDKRLTDTVATLQEAVDGQVTPPQRNRRRIRRGREFGDAIDVDRFLGRIPEMWDRMESDQVPASRVTIGINSAVSVDQHQDELGYRAAAAIVLADRLAAMGVSSEIRLMVCARRMSTGDRKTTASVVLKHSDQPVNVSELAAACCDIGVNRLAMVFGAARFFGGELDKNFGSPAAAGDLSGVEFLADTDIRCRRQAVEWIQKCISKFSKGDSNE